MKQSYFVKFFISIVVLLFVLIGVITSQSILSLNASGGVNYLFENDPAAFNPSVFGDVKIYFFKNENSPFQLGVNTSYTDLNAINNDSVSFLCVGGLASYYKPFAKRFGFRADISGGVAMAIIDNYVKDLYDTSNGIPYGITFFCGADAILNWFVTPDISLLLDIGAKYYGGMAPAVSATAGVSFLLPSSNSKLEINNILSTTVIPVFKDYYVENPVLRIDLTNKERFTIYEMQIDVMQGNLTSGNSVFFSKKLDVDEAASVYIPVTWNKSILERTETSMESVNIEISYKVSGRKRLLKKTAYCLVLGKNNFVWQTAFSETGDEYLDYVLSYHDGKTAVFVNPNEDELISLVQSIKQITAANVGYDGLPKQFKTIYATAAYLQMRQIKYQVDPNSIPYGKSASTKTDYLRFPYETLATGYGDCDDISILYASLLEAAGVPVAFITIPGHIFIAADSGLSKKNAIQLFGDTSLFIEYEEKIWMPIEITESNKGLNASWLSGIKGWTSTFDTERGFYELEEIWQEFKPANIPWREKATLFKPESELGNFATVNRNEISEFAIQTARNQFALRFSSETLVQQATEYSKIARLEFTFGKLDDAYKDIFNAILLNPSYANYYNAALIAKAANRQSDALNMLNKAIAIRNTNQSQILLASIMQDTSIQTSIIIASINNETDLARAAEQGEVLLWEE